MRAAYSDGVTRWSSSDGIEASEATGTTDTRGPSASSSGRVTRCQRSIITPEACPVVSSQFAMPGSRSLTTYRSIPSWPTCDCARVSEVWWCS